jgi:hypothetical protein
MASDLILNDSLAKNVSAQVPISDDTFVFSDCVGKDVVANFQEINDLVALINDLFANLDEMPAHCADAESHLTATTDPSYSVPLIDLNSHCFHFI